MMTELEQAIAQNFLPVSVSSDGSKSRIIDIINELIKNDFEKIIFILYRVDVQETKIKTALAQAHGQDAAEIIYNLVSEREAEKIVSRKKFSNGHQGSEEEAW